MIERLTHWDFELNLERNQGKTRKWGGRTNKTWVEKQIQYQTISTAGD